MTQPPHQPPQPNQQYPGQPPIPYGVNQQGHQQFMPPAPPFQQQAAPYVIPPRPFNHGKHFIADLLTFGCWVPFHVLLWAMHSRKSTVVMPDGRTVKR